VVLAGKPEKTVGKGVRDVDSWSILMRMGNLSRTRLCGKMGTISRQFLVSKSQRGGPRTPGPGKTIGRPPLPPELRRVKCGWFTLPPWLAEWLKDQPEAAGHIVEAALVEKYHLTPPQPNKAMQANY